jgi:hypothetical protein
MRNHTMTIPANAGTTKYRTELTRLKKTKAGLTPEDALWAPVNAILYHMEELKKKQTLPLTTLTTGLHAINEVLKEVPGKNTDALLKAMDQLEQFKKTLAHEQLKKTLQYFLIAVSLLLISGVLILAAIHFSPVMFFAMVAHAMNTTAIPGIARVLPTFTVGSIVLNVLSGAALGMITPPLWKYGKTKYSEWRYDASVKALEATIAKKKDGQDIERELAIHAQTLLDEIRHIKKTGNQTKALSQLTECLWAVNKVLENPNNIQNLEHIANIAEKISPPTSRLGQVFNLFLSALAPLATLAVILAIPMALLQGAGYAISILACRFLEFVVPFSGMGIAPNSAVGIIFLNNSMGALGEKAVQPSETKEASFSCVGALREWLGYTDQKPALEKPQTLDTAIKTLKKGHKSSQIKTEAMREKMQTFKEKFNKLAEGNNKSVITSGKK